MVEITEIVDDSLHDIAVAPTPVVDASEERRLDADEIEAAAAKLLRPTARMQLESLAKKLRKESDALKRLEASQRKQQQQVQLDPTTASIVEDEAEMPIVEDVTEKAAAAPPAPPKVAVQPPTSVKPPPPPSGAKFIPITTFAFDSGKYNSPAVSIYISLEGVVKANEKRKISRENITCEFTKTGFDLIVRDEHTDDNSSGSGKSYRFVKDNLAHDIDPAASKLVVKSDYRLILKLGKVKGKYGYDSWTELVAKKPRQVSGGGVDTSKGDDPHSSMMDLMKDLYESGDDNMRKIIGETMEKQRKGELGKGGVPGMDD